MKILDKIPNVVKRLKNPPKILYYEGNLELLSRKKVAVVGSRKASIYTKECVIQLCVKLKNAGVCVVSGGAIGVDIAAHKGSMPLTIGVFASGLDVIYPQSNAKFIKEIYTHGLAISEYPPKTLPLGFRFLERNRIVVSLCDALVVAQADLQSGSMQSARMAYEIGVPIYVLPQRIGESNGTNMLLAEQKASLINDFDDFVARFGDIKALTPDFFDDEIIEFCKNGVSLEQALDKFGDVIYEYELDGRLEINHLRVKSVM
ncbi:DNA-processing protein DprA [Campylobacter sp. faydin G-105]|uniref:DNA-processing protein DprA n=1 Tax=Campylobacter anatolicus TaxID=2829105 RepID=UPI001B94C773|nr:DNA-processing protein DprA [Campylobacter anatolicus]MBR8462003.1 DNA-processing protein DprA [Campylobacter anatolicus]